MNLETIGVIVAFIIKYFLFYPFVILLGGFLIIGSIYWVVWTFSSNQDAREETRKWANKMSYYLEYVGEIWAQIWEKIFGIVFGIIFLAIIIFVLLWLFTI